MGANITSGRRFYQEQISLLQAGKSDQVIDAHYWPDAALIGFDGIVRGTNELKQHFRQYLKILGAFEVQSTDKFIESADSIFLEATVHTGKGETRVYDAFVLRDGKISHHFTGTK